MELIDLYPFDAPFFLSLHYFQFGQVLITFEKFHCRETYEWQKSNQLEYMERIAS